MAGGCAGEIEDDEDVVISESEFALETDTDTDVADDERAADDADHDCRDGDHDGHKRHRRHWFKVLDLLDGQKDKTITVASLPPGLPDRLIAKLGRIDKNDDGLVTKREAKRFRRHRHRGE